MHHTQPAAQCIRILGALRMRMDSSRHSDPIKHVGGGREAKCSLCSR